MASVQSKIPSPRKLGDRYDVISSLGSGAQSDVFRVRDRRNGAMRAAKVLNPDSAGVADTRARFEDEFRILRTLHHPHLPDVFDYGWTDDGGRFLVMELVDGEPLDQYFRTHPEDIWMILYELCETLVFVHARNLLHQDIKPSNILVSRAPDGTGALRPVIKLIDFGLTYRRGVGAAVRLVGTPEYIAPEVVRGERMLTRAVDYYSLGATLFELLSGAPPFRGPESDVLRAHLEREPVIESEELEWAELYPHVRALLSKDVQKRLAAFEEFRRTVTGRLTGGIEDLDRSYALARIDSLGTIGKKEAWDALLRWLDQSVAGAPSAQAHTCSVTGSEGVGKRFLAAAFRAEASVRGVRTLSPAEIGWSERDDMATRQPSLMWSRLLEVCERETVVLVIDRSTLLRDEEQSFVRLAGTQWELYRSRGRVLPLFFLVAVDSTTGDADTLDYLPAEGALKLEVPTLAKDDCSQIVEHFRGSMFDPRDARALTTYLERFDACGRALQGLQRAVLRGGLTFFGQRWKAQPGLLTEIVEASQDESYAKELVASLSPLDRSVAAVASAHPEPVPATWVADFMGHDTASVISFITGATRRLLSVSDGFVAPVSMSIRRALQSGSDPAEMRRAHEFLVARLATLEHSVTSDRALAHHHEQLGQVRDAARVHLRLLKAYGAIRPRERPYELIEGVCRRGLELLESHGANISPRSQRHLFCFYLKQWVNAFWARNLFTRAKPVIDEWTKRLGETMPASVAPRYVRSVLEREGAQAALDQSTDIERRAAPMSRQFRYRLALECALAKHSLNDYIGAVADLEKIENSTLSQRDMHRTAIYRAMNDEEVHGFGASSEALSARVTKAYRDGCVDEAAMMIAMRARSAVAKGRISEALREIARGLGVSHRAGLNLRVHVFYRLAGTAYVDMNSVSRAQICFRRAVQIAGTIGMRYLTATGWARLADREVELGRIGNARRCSECARDLLGSDAQLRDINQIRVTSFTVSVLNRTALRINDIYDILVAPAAANERGYVYLWQGRDLVLRGHHDQSLESFVRARKAFEEAGIHINVVWALLQEARACLATADRQRYERVMSLARDRVPSDAPGLLSLDFRIVELWGHYLLRCDAAASVRIARSCESLLDIDAGVIMRVELLQAMFRVYARSGCVAEARRAFERYHLLVSEIVANADSQHAGAIAEMFDVTGMVDEYRAIAERLKGDHDGPPLGH